MNSMNEPNKGATRTYNSPLRAEQMEQTRERILEAAAEQLLEEGLEELSLPRAAQRARVSVPTIYRDFSRTLTRTSPWYVPGCSRGFIDRSTKTRGVVETSWSRRRWKT